MMKEWGKFYRDQNSDEILNWQNQTGMCIRVMSSDTIGNYTTCLESVWPVKKLKKVDKSWPKMILFQKLKILAPLRKLSKNVGDLGKLIVAEGFEKSNKSPNLVTLTLGWRLESG